MLAILIFAPLWAWAALVALAAAIALLEFYGLLTNCGWIAPKVAGMLLFLALVAAAYLSSARGIVFVAGTAVFLLPTLVMFASPPVTTLLPSAAGSTFGTLYVGAGAAAMVALRAIGWKPVIFVLGVVWASDSAAYYVGRRMGKRPLAPVVSPKKTLEGLWGQLAGGLVAGALVAAALTGFADAGAALYGGGMGIVVAGVAVVGDLVESTFKRSCAVKDSGGLLPGHGGLLDRLDSLLYTCPIVFLVLSFLPRALPR